MNIVIILFFLIYSFVLVASGAYVYKRGYKDGIKIAMSVENEVEELAEINSDIVISRAIRDQKKKPIKITEFSV